MKEWLGGKEHEFLGNYIVGKNFKDLTWESDPVEVELKVVEKDV